MKGSNHPRIGYLGVKVIVVQVLGRYMIMKHLDLRVLMNVKVFCYRKMATE